MKVGVRVTGGGFARAEARVEEMRRRAIERVEARLLTERDARANQRDSSPPPKPAR